MATSGVLKQRGPLSWEWFPRAAADTSRCTEMLHNRLHATRMKGSLTGMAVHKKGEETEGLGYFPSLLVTERAYQAARGKTRKKGCVAFEW